MARYSISAASGEGVGAPELNKRRGRKRSRKTAGNNIYAVRIERDGWGPEEVVLGQRPNALTDHPDVQWRFYTEISNCGVDGDGEQVPDTQKHELRVVGTGSVSEMRWFRRRNNDG